jgi:hypothetical protein
MSRTVIVILIYHRHTLKYLTLFSGLNQQRTDIRWLKFVFPPLAKVI